MFYVDRSDPRVVFCDIRSEEHTLCDGRSLIIEPDQICDFRDLPFDDEQFSVVVFDPPHFTSLGDRSWMIKKYGRLDKETWERDIRAGFSECFRVLKSSGVLVFKWNETQISAAKVSALSEYPPLIRQRVGKNDKTHWIIFVKP